MDIFFVILALLLIAALAPSLGRDSRDLNEDAWHRDGLWARTPRA
jgi:hypothetical protein